MPALHRTPSITPRPAPDQPASRPAPLDRTPLLQAERRRQIRGLLLLAAAILIFSLLRSGLHRVFTSGWWRLW